MLSIITILTTVTKNGGADTATTKPNTNKNKTGPRNMNSIENSSPRLCAPFAKHINQCLPPVLTAVLHLERILAPNVHSTMTIYLRKPTIVMIVASAESVDGKIIFTAPPADRAMLPIYETITSV